VIDVGTGEILEGHVFVAVLGYSNLTYVEVFPDETAVSWVAGICNALEYFQGVPRILTPDNAKSVIIKPCRYEPEVHAAIKGLAAHYGIAVIPARPKKPKDYPDDSVIPKNGPLPGFRATRRHRPSRGKTKLRDNTSAYLSPHNWKKCLKPIDTFRYG